MEKEAFLEDIHKKSRLYERHSLAHVFNLDENLEFDGLDELANVEDAIPIQTIDNLVRNNSSLDLNEIKNITRKKTLVSVDDLKGYLFKQVLSDINTGHFKKRKTMKVEEVETTFDSISQSVNQNNETKIILTEATTHLKPAVLDIISDYDRFTNANNEEWFKYEFIDSFKNHNLINVDNFNLNGLSENMESNELRKIKPSILDDTIVNEDDLSEMTIVNDNFQLPELSEKKTQEIESFKNQNFLDNNVKPEFIEAFGTKQDDNHSIDPNETSNANQPEKISNESEESNFNINNYRRKSSNNLRRKSSNVEISVSITEDPKTSPINHIKTDSSLKIDVKDNQKSDIQSITNSLKDNIIESKREFKGNDIKIREHEKEPVNKTKKSMKNESYEEFKNDEKVKKSISGVSKFRNKKHSKKIFYSEKTDTKKESKRLPIITENRLSLNDIFDHEKQIPIATKQKSDPLDNTIDAVNQLKFDGEKSLDKFLFNEYVRIKQNTNKRKSEVHRHQKIKKILKNLKLKEKAEKLFKSLKELRTQSKIDIKSKEENLAIDSVPVLHGDKEKISSSGQIRSALHTIKRAKSEISLRKRVKCKIFNLFFIV